MRQLPYIFIPIYFQSGQWILPCTGIAKFGFFSTDPVLLLGQQDTDGLAAALVNAIRAGNPRMPNASWSTLSAAAQALGFQREPQFEQGARLFQVRAFTKRIECSEIPRARGRGFGGESLEVRTFLRRDPAQLIAADLQARVLVQGPIRESKGRAGAA